MKRILAWSTLAILAGAAVAAESWQRMNNPSTEEAARLFVSPPPEYGAILWWGWVGDVDESVIRRDLDNIKAHGFNQVMIEAGYGMPDGYLTDGWFRRIALAVKEAGARGMRVWIEDEGKYPSGFAGGRFSKLRPDLREQALSTVMKLEDARFVNLSGQAYEAILLPSISVISKTALDQLKAFAAAGGKVVFLGRSSHSPSQRPRSR